MRIAMIGLRGLPATFGGIEKHVEELGWRLADRGHDVTVYCRPSYAASLAPVPAVLLSGQATDVSVNKATRRLFVVANTPGKMLALGEQGLAEYSRGGGRRSRL